MTPEQLRELAVAASICRQAGKTHAICEIAKKLNATVFVPTNTEAVRLKELYQVKTALVGSGLKLRGTRGPYLFDNFAVEDICHRAANAIELEKSRSQGLVEALEELIIIAEQWHPSPGYSEAILEAKQALQEYSK